MEERLSVSNVLLVMPVAKTKDKILSIRGKIHAWTNEEDTLLRENYKQTIASAQSIAISLNLTISQVQLRCGLLGLSKRTKRLTGRYWSPNEDMELEKMWNKLSLHRISAILHRSIQAVKLRGIRLGLSHRINRDGWYTKAEVSEILGINDRRVQSYIDDQQLKATIYSGRIGCIKEKDLRSFMRKYAIEFQGRNIDLYQWVEILAG